MRITGFHSFRNVGRITRRLPRIALLTGLSLLMILAPSIAQAQDTQKDYEEECIGIGRGVGCALYDPNSSGCVTGGVSDGAVDIGATQEANAKTLIGVAKTLNIGQQGALIGLMVGLAESGLKNYANTGVPLSMQNPSWLALPEPRPLGKDHDSVGIMQQRPSTGWSTIASGDAALSNRDAIWQLMNPAYAAQAFFGSPPGSNMPPALSKGLQNKAGWQSMSPWIAAQKVQASAFSDGRNYKAKQAQAQQLLGQYWELSPPVGLAVPLGGGGSAANPTADPSLAECTGDASVNCSPDGTSLATDTRSKVVCIAKQELALWQVGQIQPGNGYFKYSQGRQENWCADFASWVYNRAGYPLAATKDGNVPLVKSIKEIGEKNQNFHWHPAGGYTPKPGDLAIHQIGRSHVNIVVAVNGTTVTLIGGNQGKKGFNNSLVTQYDIRGFGSDGTNGYVSPD